MGYWKKRKPPANMDRPICALTNCPLYGHLMVGSEENPHPMAMLVGEAPGQEEEESGFPFVGKSGRELTMYLERFTRIPRNRFFITNLVRCLDGATLIKTENGWARINWMHKTHFDGEVYCVDENGLLTTRRVKNVIKTPLGNRRLYKVCPRYGKNASNRTKIGAYLTGDHLILTVNGWKQVGELAASDMVHTGFYKPSGSLLRAIVGMLIGDSHLDEECKALTIMHCDYQLDYLKHKHNLLGGKFESFGVIDRGKCRNVNHFRSTRYREWFRRFYPFIRKNKKRIITEELLNHFGVESLAFLFMDDGYMHFRPPRSARAEIATCSYSYGEVHLLLEKLRNMGLDAYTLENKIYPRVYFDVNNTRKLSLLIAPYVLTCMDYKILPEHRQLEKVVITVEEEPLYSEVDVILSEKRPKSVYDIEVDGLSNFLTHAGVVHNCRPPKNRDPSKHEIEICSVHLMVDLGEVEPAIVGAVGRLSTQWFLGPVKMEKVHGVAFEKDGRIVVPLYHPAYGLHSPRRMKEIIEDFTVLGEVIRGERGITGAFNVGNG